MPSNTGFWSGTTLRQRLPSLVTPYDPDNVDCAAYTLRIGPQIYVSPNEESTDPTSITLRELSQGESFTIPPGQFAFLLTEEIIEVPVEAIGWISIRAKIKFRGLVNVSGFHVDPGFKGRLVYSVFNSGPVPVHLQRGQKVFLIWFSYLDEPSSDTRSDQPQLGIDPAIITSVAGEMKSLSGISKKIDNAENRLLERIHSLEREQAYYRLASYIVLAVLVGVLVKWFFT